MARAQAGAVEKAVRAELRGRRVSVQTVGLAALAVNLARRVDREQDNAVAASVARALSQTLTAVVKAAPDAVAAASAGRGAPASPPRGGVDDLQARRAARLGQA